LVGANPRTRSDGCATTLAERGKTFMPLAEYGFSRRFAWTRDRFGVTWQLNRRAGTW